MEKKISVSIPYRYGIYANENLSYSQTTENVSIPYRYGIYNFRICKGLFKWFKMFQFLIGMVSTLQKSQPQQNMLICFNSL